MRSLKLKYNLYFFFSNLIFQKGIFMIFLATQKGVSNTEIAIMQVSLLLGMFLTEIPAGIIGDKYGRKISVLTGIFLLTFSSLGFIYFDAFWILCILFMFEGIGMGFTSGSDQSLLYDNLKKLKKEKQFLSSMSMALAISYVALGIASIVGGLVQHISWTIVYGASSLALLLSAMFFLLIKEYRPSKDIQINDNTIGSLSDKKNITKEMKKYFSSKNGKAILLLFLLIGIFEATCMAYFMFSQRFFEVLGLGVFEISVLFMIGRLLSGLSYYFAPKIVSIISSRKVVTISMLSTAVILLFNFLDIWVFYFISFAAITIFPYIASVINLTYIHDRIPSEIRSSIVSVGSMLGAVFLGLAYLLIGFLLDTTSLNITTVIVGLINLLAVIIFLIKTKKLEMETEENAKTA
ncbi:MFS transporter [Bacillus sp. C1-1]|nr:MFS transporter [Bacillus sp. C1-1]